MEELLMLLLVPRLEVNEPFELLLLEVAGMLLTLLEENKDMLEEMVGSELEALYEYVEGW